MDTLIEESYKNAYEVTKDLKEGVIFAVETLANEALYYMHHVANKPFGKYIQETDSYDETDDDFETEVKDDCLTPLSIVCFSFSMPKVVKSWRFYPLEMRCINRDILSNR